MLSGAVPALAGDASADAPGPYRAQTALADGAAALVMLGALESRTSSTETSLAELAGATFVVGAPVVHLAHGRYGRSALSFALRVSLPLVGVALGSSRSCAWDDDACWSQRDQAQLTGLLAGAVLAAVIDSALLAGGDDRPAPPPRVVPTVGAPGSGLTLGLAGSF